MNKEKEIVELLNEAMEIAGEAIYLANEYAGGESETALALNEQFEKLEHQVWEVTKE